MMAKKTATNARALAGQKRHRRQWLTFMRMCRYGVNNFTRNAWLTVAATAVMTITLLIIFVTVVAQNVLADTTTQVGRRVDRSIYLKTGTTEDQAKKILSDLRSLSNVDSVRFVSTDEGRAEFAQQNKSSDGALEALTQATNKIPATVRITLKDVNDTSQLVEYVKTSDSLKAYIDPSRQPTFMSERKSATDTIAAWTRTAQQLGIGASILFTSISMLIIFNTIRMAIFNRKEEIQMMKLIGAERSFIRGPFIGVGLLYSTQGTLSSWGVSVGPTLSYVISYIGFVLLGMIVLGGLLGTISSLLATRRYLKI